MPEKTSDQNELHEGIDYYWENGRVVFTAHLLKKRGRCCDTGCRHCPYKSEPAQATAPVSSADEASH